MVSAIWLSLLMGMTGSKKYAVCSIEVPLIMASKYHIIIVIEDIFRVRHLYDLSLLLLADDDSGRSHTFNGNG